VTGSLGILAPTWRTSFRSLQDEPEIIITNEQVQGGLEAAGMPTHIAAGLVEMNASIHSGALEEDYYRNRPAVMGKVKLTDFAKEFAAAFNQK